MARRTFIDALAWLANLGALPDDGDDERLRKATLTLAAGMLVVIGALWGVGYALLGLRAAAPVPVIYSLASLATLVVFARTRRYAPFRFLQLLLILVLPFATQWALGGYANSGAVMVWAFMAPLGALMFHGIGRAVAWFAGFLGLTVAFGFLEGPLAAVVAPVPDRLRHGFFVMNIAGVMTALYLITRYFVQEREAAQERSERLLLNVLPAPIAARLKRAAATIADHYADVTVLFADIVDFTRYSAGITPNALVDVLNDIFTDFDHLADRLGLEKIKTIGDAYMAVAGLPRASPDHAEAAAEMALAMQETLAACGARNNAAFQLRIGLHSGPVVAGVIGRRKFIYDLWGDTVNTASRMESLAPPGAVQVTRATFERLRDRYAFEERGPIPVKGKGEMVTYLLTGRRPQSA